MIMSDDKQEQEQAKMARDLKTAIERLGTPTYLDYLRYTAMDRHSKFKAYLEAGFTEQQAIQLSKE